MTKAINKEVLHSALAELGWTQAQLAEKVGVSSQSVTNWVKGNDFPRPATLLKLAAALRLKFDELVSSETDGRPVIAFRKKGSAKTTQKHIGKAHEIGMLLRPLVPYLSDFQVLRTLITKPSLDYTRLQTAVSQTRERLGVGEQAVIGYEQLIGEFQNSGAVLVPVMWGAKDRHENALHIRLPKEDITFIFLNLDTHIEDFKFWMAHELAHVYTPDLAGTEAGEDFADAFAGGLLFPKACAEIAYREAQKNRPGYQIGILQNYAAQHFISLNTVYQQISYYAKAEGCPPLDIDDKSIHVARNMIKGQLVSAALFDPTPPEPHLYLAACEHAFQSDFFKALERMLNEKGTGASYIQQILDISLADAKALHEAMSH